MLTLKKTNFFNTLLWKLVRWTEPYLELKSLFNATDARSRSLERQRDEFFATITEFQETKKQNDTKLRKVIRLLNANFDKKNATIKQVKEICNEIIKGTEKCEK